MNSRLTYFLILSMAFFSLKALSVEEKTKQCTKSYDDIMGKAPGNNGSQSKSGAKGKVK